MNKICMLWLCVSFLWLAPAQAQPSPSVISNLQQAVVRVESGSKVGTGFLWRNPRWVVTTMHLIANQNQIQVTLHSGVRKARVHKVLREHDLVLLELESAAAAPNTLLRSLNASPALHSSLYTLSYNGGGNQNTLIDRSFRLGYSSNGRLEGLLPPAVKSALTACRMPNPSIQILYLEGALLPGFSGAPIVDDAGTLVGIADGGLEKGASSISWGIRASQLEELQTSAEALPASMSCLNSGSVRFGADQQFDAEDLQVVEVDGSTFVTTKTRTIAQMMATVDDPAGLQQLLHVYAFNNSFNYLAFSYDIYEDLLSGAALCVPAGSVPTINNGMMEIHFPRERMAWVAWLSSCPSTSTVPWVRYTPCATAFQNKIIARDGGNLAYQFDASSSYRAPLFKWDGTIANRLAFLGLRAGTNPWGQR